MNTLLPPAYQTAFRREKIARLIFSCGMLFVVVLLVGIVCMAPSYFVLVLSRGEVLRQLAAEEEALKRKEITSVEAAIDTVNAKLSILEKNESRRYLFSSILSPLVNQVFPGVKISSIELRRGADNGFMLALQGTADTRDNLLAYINRLKASREISSLDAPISNVLKENNISFYVEASLKPELYRYVQR